MDIAEIRKVLTESTENTLSMMASTHSSPGETLILEHSKTWGDITGFLGLAGKNCRGSFSISFEKKTILNLASTMLMEDFLDIDKDVTDTVGELTNMIAGQLKKTLIDQGNDVGMASPFVIAGKGIGMRRFSGTKLYQIPFSSSAGDFVIEVNFKND